VRELSHARQTVHVQAYSFTSPPIAQALTDAEERDVKVIAILDAGNRTRNYSAADFLAHEGIETYIDSQHRLRVLSRENRKKILQYEQFRFDDTIEPF
jgi:hypothetical protein